jgi:general stress protein 26
MGDVKDVTGKEAVARLKEIAEDVKVCMFCTDLTTLPIHSRPMSVQEVDEQGNLWFMSSKKSNKNFEIAADKRVQLFFSKMSDSHFLSVYGTASIYRDRDKIAELWTPVANAWVKDGKDDPDLTVIKVTPSAAYYWDEKDGRLVSLIKIAAAMVTGNNNDGGIEGMLKV